ncbi:MAG: hypothetical protein KF894_04600 [Labilithrix sp.]|nr:hypothetical protein [Labilithrix sp.]
MSPRRAPCVPLARERLSPALLAELYELEEDGYRVALREARRIRSGPPAAALRAVVAHAGESLEEIPELARARGVRLGGVSALALDTLRRLGDALLASLVDHDHAYRRALTALRRGVDLVRLTRAAALDEGDERLAVWCRRWLGVRERLVAETADELEWFARHPFFARLPATPLASTS